MDELAAVIDLLDVHAPAYIRKCIATADQPARFSMPPSSLSSAAARMVREIAEDAFVRSLARPKEIR